MKKYLLIGFLVFLTGCGHSAKYNENAVFSDARDDLVVVNPMQAATIYVDKNLMKNFSLKPSSRLGHDEKMSINLGEFAQNSAKTFFSNYMRNLNLSSKPEALNAQGLVIMPEIKGFEYGFDSSDGIDIDPMPYVLYDYRLNMFKNGRQIYSKKLSVDEKFYGDKIFWAGGNAAFEQVAPLFQKALVNDLNRHADEIISAINSN